MMRFSDDSPAIGLREDEIGVYPLVVRTENRCEAIAFESSWLFGSFWSSKKNKKKIVFIRSISIYQHSILTAKNAKILRKERKKL